MGQTEIKNLSKENILVDYGKVPTFAIKDLEKSQNIILPKTYVNFITQHNGASLNRDAFDYFDPNIERKNSDSIAFGKAEKILESIKLLQLNEEPDWDIKYKFEDGLIPFGENGGGDMICFDYRNDRTTDNPPIVIWNHDMGFDHRVVFIANNFEKFINMLYEPEDLFLKSVFK